jgi:hypothetical protein
MDRKVIFHIENRGASYIYHWFIYMIAGLRHLKTGGSSGSDGSGRLEKNIEFFDLKKLKSPYYIYLNKDLSGIFSFTMADFQKETFELLKDDFLFIEKENIKDSDIIINNYGEYIIDNEFHIPKEGYDFLKSFENKIQITDEDINKYSKNFYISRNKSHLLDGNKIENNIKRRHILNEDNFIEYLSNNGFETIFLEDFSLYEKIKLFKLAKTIISPNSGGLTFALYSSPNTHIIELNVDNPHQISRQYEDICRCYNIKYNRFICEKIDHLDNMVININLFKNFIENN